MYLRGNVHNFAFWQKYYRRSLCCLPHRGGWLGGWLWWPNQGPLGLLTFLSAITIPNIFIFQDHLPILLVLPRYTR